MLEYHRTYFCVKWVLSLNFIIMQKILWFHSVFIPQEFLPIPSFCIMQLDSEHTKVLPVYCSNPVFLSKYRMTIPLHFCCVEYSHHGTKWAKNRRGFLCGSWPLYCYFQIRTYLLRMFCCGNKWEKVQYNSAGEQNVFSCRAVQLVVTGVWHCCLSSFCPSNCCCAVIFHRHLSLFSQERIHLCEILFPESFHFATGTLQKKFFVALFCWINSGRSWFAVTWQLAGLRRSMCVSHMERIFSLNLQLFCVSRNKKPLQ